MLDLIKQQIDLLRCEWRWFWSFRFRRRWRRWLHRWRRRRKRPWSDIEYARLIRDGVVPRIVCSPRGVRISDHILADTGSASRAIAGERCSPHGFSILQPCYFELFP